MSFGGCVLEGGLLRLNLQVLTNMGVALSPPTCAHQLSLSAPIPSVTMIHPTTGLKQGKQSLDLGTKLNLCFHQVDGLLHFITVVETE